MNEKGSDDLGKNLPEYFRIQSNDYWVRVVEMLQQNWALIEPVSSGGVCVYFIGDTSGIFDELTFPSTEVASAALRRNGFSRYADDRQLQEFLNPPSPPFQRMDHPNGPIYSSGRFWKR